MTGHGTGRIRADGCRRGAVVVVPRLAHPPPRRPDRDYRPPCWMPAAAPGGFLTALRAHRPDLRATGVEWAAMAARARAKSAAPVARGSVNALPFASARFGAAVSADVLCHGAVDPVLTLAELRRVLRPRGRLVVKMADRYSQPPSSEYRHGATSAEAVVARSGTRAPSGPAPQACRTEYDGCPVASGPDQPG